MSELDGQLMLQEVAAMAEAAEDAHYAAFVDKFKPKKTTDDCYTPDNIMEAVQAWVAAEYHLDPACSLRPFWPGADYQAADYPPGAAERAAATRWPLSDRERAISSRLSGRTSACPASPLEALAISGR